MSQHRKLDAVAFGKLFHHFCWNVQCWETPESPSDFPALGTPMMPILGYKISGLANGLSTFNFSAAMAPDIRDNLQFHLNPTTNTSDPIFVSDTICTFGDSDFMMLYGKLCEIYRLRRSSPTNVSPANLVHRRWRRRERCSLWSKTKEPALIRYSCSHGLWAVLVSLCSSSCLIWHARMLTIERQYPIQQINIVNPLCCVTRWPTGTCSEACSTVLGLARLGFKGSVALATRAATADLYKQAERNSKENTLRANKSRVVQCGSFILPLIPINWRRAKLNDFRLFGLGSEICLLVLGVSCTQTQTRSIWPCCVSSLAGIVKFHKNWTQRFRGTWGCIFLSNTVTIARCCRSF